MKMGEFVNLKRGDIIQNVGSGSSYVVHDLITEYNPNTNHDDVKSAFVVRTTIASNPSEWKKVSTGFQIQYP